MRKKPENMCVVALTPSVYLQNDWFNANRFTLSIFERQKFNLKIIYFRVI